MPFHPDRHHRRSVRLQDADYAPEGVYFVTVCTFGRQRLFGEVNEGVMCLSRFGRIAVEEWARTEEVRPYVVLDAFVVMPDHVHLLFGIRPHEGNAPPRGSDTTPVARATHRVAPTITSGPPRGSVGSIIGQYKSVVTKRVRAIDPTVRVWQRSFWDRVVRTEREADALRRYIAENPAKWDPDADRPDGHHA